MMRARVEISTATQRLGQLLALRFSPIRENLYYQPTTYVDFNRQTVEDGLGRLLRQAGLCRQRNINDGYQVRLAH